MKILFTGGGTGGHFYPLIAVAEKVNKVIDQNKIVGAKLYYMSDSPYDASALFENGITFISATSGKNRLYASIENITDLIKIGFGCVTATLKLFFLYPDVLFSKGGYASIPALFAARLLGIPIVIHDSDSVPGRVSLWSAKFARRIGTSYPDAVDYFPKEKTAHTGQPIREEIAKRATEGAHEYWKLDKSIPTLFIFGGSQGSQIINNTLIDILPALLANYQIIHQVGPNNLIDTKERVSVVLEGNQYQERYKFHGTFNPLMVKMAAGAADVVISRAGSSIFEIANWGLPSIIIPIPESVSRDQHTNAFNYARAGACHVIDEVNLTPSVLESEIRMLLDNPEKRETLSKNALAFGNPNAAQILAEEIVKIALTHEQ